MPISEVRKTWFWISLNKMENQWELRWDNSTPTSTRKVWSWHMTLGQKFYTIRLKRISRTKIRAQCTIVSAFVLSFFHTVLHNLILNQINISLARKGKIQSSPSLFMHFYFLTALVLLLIKSSLFFFFPIVLVNLNLTHYALSRNILLVG